MSARYRREPIPRLQAASKPKSKLAYTRHEQVLLEQMDALFRFHGNPFVRFWISVKGNLDTRLIHFRIRWLDTKNPYYVWRAIDTCITSRREFAPWIVEYLSGCAARMLSLETHDLREVLSDILGFSCAKPDRNGVMPKHLLRPGDEDAYIYLAVAEYFVEEIQKGAAPVEARKRKAFHQETVESLAAHVHEKLFDVDDKTLRINIEKCFGVKESPRTNAEWRQFIDAWYRQVEQVETIFGK
jgi:hypothetical protein